jgi:hypothetical protein
MDRSREGGDPSARQREIESRVGIADLRRPAHQLIPVPPPLCRILEVMIAFQPSVAEGPMTTPHVLRSPGEPLLGAGLTALLGVLLFLACNRDSKEAEIVGPQEPVAEEVDRGRLSPASLTLPFSGTVNSSFNTAGFRITQLGQGDGGAFGIQNTGNGHPALIGFTNGYGPGVRGSNTGAGPAGDFRTS